MIFLPTAGESLELCSRKDAAGHIPYARRGTVITEGSLASSSRYSLCRGEPRPEKCAMPRPPVCLTPMGGTLKKAACARSAPCPACIRGCVRRFPEGPLPGTGGVLFLPRSRGGVICCFFTEQSMFFSGRHAFTPWHGASGRKRTMLNEKALTMFHRKGLTFSGSPRRT